MRIPLNTEGNRILVELSLRVQQPGTLAIVAAHPTQPHTDYFRRVVRFRPGEVEGGEGKRLIMVPLPLTPERLHLDIFDFGGEGPTHFKLREMAVRTLPPVAIWASQEQHDFNEFAMEVIQKMGYMEPGYYTSDDLKYLIQVVPTLRDHQENELITPARIHRLMPRIQASQKQMRRFSIPMRAAIMFHEVCHYHLNTRSEQTADLCGIDYYVKYGFPRIEGVYALTKVFLQHPGSLGKGHVKRVTDVVNHLKRFPDRFHPTLSA